MSVTYITYSRQHWILNPLSEAGGRTHILMDASQVRYCWATVGTPHLFLRKSAGLRPYTTVPMNFLCSADSPIIFTPALKKKKYTLTCFRLWTSWAGLVRVKVNCCSGTYDFGREQGLCLHILWSVWSTLLRGKAFLLNLPGWDFKGIKSWCVGLKSRF